MIEVVAIAQGFDGICVREPGSVFEMPDDVFDKRQKLDEKGQPIQGMYYEPPNWFEPTDKSLRAKVEQDRKDAKRGPRGPSAVNPQAQQAAVSDEARRAHEEQEAQREAAIAKVRDEEKVAKQRKQAEEDRKADEDLAKHHKKGG